MTTTTPLDENTAKEVLRQVEFYFSDSNVPRDNFLRNTIKSSEDGMVSLALICSFKKMRGYLRLGEISSEEISEDTVQAVAEILRKSASLKISDDGKKVGRISTLAKPEEAIEQLDIRTIAASPLQYEVKWEDVEAFFNQHAKVTSVRLPRHLADKRVFCGTALIEFSSEEDAEKVLKQSLVFEGAQLELKPKKEFDSERAEKAKELEKTRPSSGSDSKSNANSESDYPKGLIVAFTFKSKLSGDTVQQNVVDNSAILKEDGEPKGSEQELEKSDKENCEVHTDEKEEDEKKVDESEEVKSEESDKSPEDLTKTDEAKGKKTNAAAYKDDMNVVLREDLKAAFEKFGVVKFVDFKIGEDSGYIRYEQPEATQKACGAAVLANEGGLIVKNFIATLEAVTGDAEKEYWSLLRGNQEKHHKDHKAGRGRGGKYQRGVGKRRSRENDSGRPNKAQKVSH